MSIWAHDTSCSVPSIQMAGIVKATPPATMEPADMMIWVTLASFRLCLPSSLRATRAVMEVNTDGQGSAPQEEIWGYLAKHMGDRCKEA
jgi:hypothetical protein